jgi:hypothetical protein
VCHRCKLFHPLSFHEKYLPSTFLNHVM